MVDVPDLVGRTQSGLRAFYAELLFDRHRHAVQRAPRLPNGQRFVSGAGTGQETAIDDLRTVREAVPGATILVGSGSSDPNWR